MLKGEVKDTIKEAVEVKIAIGVSFLGWFWVFTGKAPEGALATTSGTASSVLCCRIAKDANDRLDDLLKELTD